MITKADLKTQTKSELGRLAKGLGVSDWQSMRKEDLVALLSKKKAQGESSKAAAAKKTSALPKKAAAKKVEPTKVVPKKVEAKGGAKAVPMKAAADTKLSHREKASASSSKSNEKAVSKQLAPASAKAAPSKLTANTNGKSSGRRATAEVAQAPVKAALKTSLTPKKGQVKEAAEVKAAKKKGSDVPAIAKKEATAAPAKTSINKPVGKAPANPAIPPTSKKKSVEAPKPEKKKPVAKKHVSTTDVKILEQLRKLQEQRDQYKDLAQPPMKLADPVHFAEKLPPKPEDKDRVALIVRDPFWLQASWDVSRRAIERARASMAEHWHTAKPTLRLLSIGGAGSTNASETVDRDIEVHGGVRNWYIEIKNSPSTFRVLLGYLASNGRFHELSRSNIVTTPAPGSADAVDGNWADIAQDCEHIFALSGGYNAEHESKELQEVFEDRLKRPMGSPPLTQFGSGAEAPLKRKKEFQFDIDAEMILFGVTHIDAYVTLGGEPVKIREDGSFSVRLPLPDRRQVLPAVASSRDGSEQRTIVIAVERNTKVMEPLSKENEE